MIITSSDGKTFDALFYTHAEFLARFGVKCPCPELLRRLPDACILLGDREQLWYEVRVCLVCDLVIESMGGELYKQYPYLAGMKGYRRKAGS